MAIGMRHVMVGLAVGASTAGLREARADILYDQVLALFGDGASQDFEAIYDGSDCQGADDFTVPPGTTCCSRRRALPFRLPVALTGFANAPGQGTPSGWCSTMHPPVLGSHAASWHAATTGQGLSPTQYPTSQ
jgi:hypothetical protein